MAGKEFIAVLSTAGSDDEAEKIADALVEERLVACVNYFRVKSVYRWKGKVEKSGEYVLLCKTVKEKYAAVEEKIRELHSYECPEVVALPVCGGSETYLRWVGDSTRM